MKQKKLVAEIIAMQDILYRFASRLTSNENDAKDLLQETSYRALKGQNDYIEYGTVKVGYSPLCETHFSTTNPDY